MTKASGTIVLNEALSAMVVFLQKWNQHFSAKCAGNYFQSQHMSKNSGAIGFNRTLAAMVVGIQNAPIHTSGRVLAATTVNAK
eukprot:5384188-Karenia_brevis.AAC.1